MVSVQVETRSGQQQVSRYAATSLPRRVIARGKVILGNKQLLERWLFDFRNILLQPELLNRYAEIFWQLYVSRYPFQVCGMESAAISLVSAIVMKGVERTSVRLNIKQ